MKRDAPLLSVRDLTVELRTDDGPLSPIKGVSFDVMPGEVFGVVGESGSGKTITMMSLLRLLDKRSVIEVGGSAEFDGRDLLQIEEKKLRWVRGGDIGFIFQDPLSSLNPTMTIGGQIAEAIQRHQPDLSPGAVSERIHELLGAVGIANPRERVRQYPFEFSGGMRQRAMIAIAIANNPKLIVADEPTTALDVTIQMQVLDTLHTLTSQLGSALVLITHDLGVIAEMADRVMVMYAGRVAEIGDVGDIFTNPKHPYTLGLLASRPTASNRDRRLLPIKGAPPGLVDRLPGCAFEPRCSLGAGRELCQTTPPELSTVAAGRHRLSACHFVNEMDAIPTVANEPSREKTLPDGGLPLLSVRALDKEFRLRGSGAFGGRRSLRAVRAAEFDLYRGRTLGLVGESGSGKSTIARLLVRVLDPTQGEIRFDGEDITAMSTRSVRAIRSKIQLVLQDPSSSLNPRMTAGQTIIEAIRVHTSESQRSAAERMHGLLELVGLRPEHARRYPHEFSAGQRQRISIARAIAVEPQILILDEPVSALDVSVRAQVINLLEEIQARLGIGFLLISHDLSIVRYIADWVAVMYLGRIVEIGPAEQVFLTPQHPYTQSILKSIPVDDPSQRSSGGRFILSGEIPNPMNPPSGCPFRTRCDRADDICATQFPMLDPVGSGNGHRVACYHPGRSVSQVGTTKEGSNTNGLSTAITQPSWLASWPAP